MTLPSLGSSYAQERLGIAAVQSYAARIRQIWRETPTGDVGIDGNLEFVNENGFATGRILAVQVKSGPSYFSHPTKNGWKFYPEDKHRNYWKSFPLPVLLILHDPDASKSYWVDARQVLRSPNKEPSYIEVPKQNVLEETTAISLFENAGVQGEPFISDLEEVLNQLLAMKSSEGTFPLSYFDLFVQGLTNLCRSIYYGMDLVCTAVEYNLEAVDSPFGMGIGHREQEFAFSFVKFLLAQDLAQIDYSDCLIDWVDRDMQPHFVAPLTSRGRNLVRLIHAKEAELITDGKMLDDGGRRVAQEGFFAMDIQSYFMRLSRIRAFQEANVQGL